MCARMAGIADNERVVSDQPIECFRGVTVFRQIGLAFLYRRGGPIACVHNVNIGWVSLSPIDQNKSEKNNFSVCRTRTQSH